MVGYVPKKWRNYFIHHKNHVQTIFNMFHPVNHLKERLEQNNLFSYSEILTKISVQFHHNFLHLYQNIKLETKYLYSIESFIFILTLTFKKTNSYSARVVSIIHIHNNVHISSQHLHNFYSIQRTI